MSPAELDDVLEREDRSKLESYLVMAPSQTQNHKYLVTLFLLCVWQKLWNWIVKQRLTTEYFSFF